MQDVGNPASLKPPIPPLTRYKRDVVAKQQATDLEGAPRLGSTRPASLLHAKYALHLSSSLDLLMEAGSVALCALEARPLLSCPS